MFHRLRLAAASDQVRFQAGPFPERYTQLSNHTHPPQPSVSSRKGRHLPQTFGTTGMLHPSSRYAADEAPRRRTKLPQHAHYQQPSQKNYRLCQLDFADKESSPDEMLDHLLPTPPIEAEQPTPRIISPD